MIYKRIILKVSGKCFRFKNENVAYTTHAVNRLADEIAFISGQGIKIGIVTGGSNIMRGRNQKDLEMIKNPKAADIIGIVATISNAHYLKALLEGRKIETKIYIASPPYYALFSDQHEQVSKDMEDTKIIIFAGGIGKEGYTADYAAACYSVLMKIPAIFKGIKVDGFYKKDPFIDQKQKPISEVSREKALKMNIDRVFNAKALSKLEEEESKTNIHLFNYFENLSANPENRNLWKILQGEKIGTMITP